LVVSSRTVEPSFWRGKRVFVTGHTGFKGGWLSTWLASMGAQVKGYALAPSTDPGFFEATGLAQHLEHVVADVRDRERLARELTSFGPEVVFHLAAQPLVRHSYDAPVETYETNVMGTLNLLEAVRQSDSVRVVVNVTTDKCYENREREHGYREDEALGGHDPYSSSKACSEILTASYRRSFFAEGHVRLASARAGNVLGGGDWNADRLIPDAARAFAAQKIVEIRSRLGSPRPGTLDHGPRG
jgi:CDP-glucose 4,6-dehydratase